MKKISHYRDLIQVFILKFLGMFIKYIIMFYLSSQIMTSEEFGKFSFYLATLNLIYLLLGFGIIDSAMYRIVNTSCIKEKREIAGVSIALLSITSMIGIVIIPLFLDDYSSMVLISLLSVGNFMYTFTKKLCVALNEINVIKYFESVLYTMILIVLIMSGSNSTSTIIILYMSVLIIVSLIYIEKMNITLRFKGKQFKEILNTIKEYGLKVHLSQVMAMGTYDLDKFILKYTGNISGLGTYTLFLNFVTPVKLFTQSIVDLSFSKMANQKKIDFKIIVINIVFTVIGSVFIMVVGKIIIENLYSEEYYIIKEYLNFLPILSILGTAYIPVNNFFSAKGLANYKFINALVLAISNIILNLVLVPKFKVIGAIVATIIALLINNILFIVQYIGYLKNIETRKELSYD